MPQPNQSAIDRIRAMKLRAAIHAAWEAGAELTLGSMTENDQLAADAAMLFARDNALAVDLFSYDAAQGQLAGLRVTRVLRDGLTFITTYQRLDAAQEAA